MEIEIRPDKYVQNNMPSGFALCFGETIRYNQRGIEIIDKFPGDLGTAIVTNFRVFWYSQSVPGRNVSVGYERVIAVGRRKMNAGEPDETQVVCILTYDCPWHREYVFKNSENVYDLHYIKVILDIFRAYTSTNSYREVLTQSNFIENGELKLLPCENIFICVDGVRNLNNPEWSPGTYILTNLRSVWYDDYNEENNISVPFLCVEKVNVVPTEYGDAFVMEVLEDNKLYGWKFHADPPDKQQFLLGHLCGQLVQYKDQPFVGF